MRARFAIVGLALAIAACATVPSATASFEIEFTGEFADGVPVYRFPAMEVVGIRRGIDKDM